MAKVDEGVVGVLRHGLARAELGAHLGDELAGRGVLVLEVASVSLGIKQGVRIDSKVGEKERESKRTHDRREEKVVREELHLVDLDVVAELVDLESALVVDVDVLLLRDGIEGLIVKPADGANGLAEV